MRRGAVAELGSELRAVGSLDQIAADPASVDALSDAEAAQLMQRAQIVVYALQVRHARPAMLEVMATKGRERCLSPREVAERLGRSVSWVEKHLAALPPRRSFGGALGWRESEINDWIRNAPRV